MGSLSSPRRARYRFRTVWELPAPATTAYAVLGDLGSYPLWWPQVRRVEELDAGRVELLCRAMLPYHLRFVVHRPVADPGRRVLEAELAGDLEGFSRWTVRPDGERSRALFEEEVTTSRPLLNALAPVARPLLRMNHAWMMRSGERGLRSFLAGVGYARREAPDADRPGPPRRGTGPAG